MSTEESNEKKGFSEKNSQLIALTALIFTIFATFASLYAGGNANNAIMSENMANNCWVYYQSKSMKEDMCHIQLEFLKHSSTENEDPEKVE